MLTSFAILDDEEDEQPEKRQKVFEARGLQSRADELAELGKPNSRSGCFGCVYIGEQKSAPVQYDDIAALLKMIQKSIAYTDPKNLCIHVAAKYKLIQTEINSGLLPDETPLPNWTAASILNHIRMHNADPEIQQWLRMCELQELAQIALHDCIEVDIETGVTQVNDRKVKIYLEIVKAMETLSKSDPSKKMFFSHGSHIDLTTGAQGAIAISGKNIVNYFKQ